MHYSLSMSGGGSSGSFSAGSALFAAESGFYPEGFDSITGVSVGSVNALFLATFPKTRFKEAAEKLVQLWTNIEGTEDIWHYRFPKYFSAFWQNSLGKNDPLIKKLKAHINLENLKTSGVILRMGAVNLLNGEYKEFTETEYPIEGVLASSSFPLFFPPVEIESEFYTDGGIRTISPLESSIKLGADKILCLLCQNIESFPIKTKKELNTVPKIAMRLVDIMTNEIVLNDIQQIKFINDLIKSDVKHPMLENKKFIEIDLIHPTSPRSNSLSFTKKDMIRQIDQGYNDAKNYFAKKGIDNAKR